MADQRPPPPPAAAVSARPIHSTFCRVLALVLLGLIVIVGLAVLIAWLIIRPRHIVYVVEDAAVHGYNLSSKNHLNATFYLLIRTYNPNTRVSIHYDSVEASVSYSDQMVAFQSVDPFFQGHQNTTRLELSMVARDVVLQEDAARQLAVEKGSGAIDIELRIKARIRFKVGKLKTRDRALHIYCSPVAHFSHVEDKSFQRIFCDTDY